MLIEDFSGGPVVETLGFQCRGAGWGGLGSITDQGTKTLFWPIETAKISKRY